MVRVAAALACHDRRETTLRCLRTLHDQDMDGVDVDVYLLDDGSSDGTGDAVVRSFPDTVLLHGDGTLFWARGMRRALEAASRHGYDHYLWLNDDTALDPDALGRLLSTAAHASMITGQQAIVVGACRDPDTGALTYGGRHRPSRLRRHRFVTAPVSPHPQPVETMHGNVVLVPREVVERIGHLDGTFRHGFADEDYGLRARRAGFTVWLAPGTVATCASNRQPTYGRQRLLDDVRDLTALTGGGLPPQDWARLMRRWAGPLWPIFWASPYVRRTARVLLAHLPAREAANGGPHAGQRVSTRRSSK